MQYPLTHGSKSTGGLMPRVHIVDASGHTIAHVIGRTDEDAVTNAQHFIDVYNAGYRILHPAPTAKRY